MSNEMIVRLLTGLSLATISNLTARDNGIGAIKYSGVEGFNELYKIRKSIVDEKIALRLKDKDVRLNPKSFLGMISDDIIMSNKYESAIMKIDDTETNIVVRLADILESELMTVKNGLIPDVNQLAGEIEEVIAGMTVSNLQSDFNLVYGDANALLKIIIDAEEITANTNTDISSLNFRFPSVNTIGEIKEYVAISNPIVQMEINKILNLEKDEYWINLYNAIFGNLSKSNEILKLLKDEKMLGTNKTVILYLIARNFNRQIPFTLEGSKSDITFNVRILKEYLSDVLFDTYSIAKALKMSNVLITYNKNKTIVVDKTLMVDGIDADVVIAAAMEGLMYQADILKDRDALKAKFIKTNEMFIIGEANKLATSYRRTYVNLFDKILADDAVYTENRLKFNDFIYGMDIEDLKVTKKVISKVLLKTKYIEGNCDFIMDRMKHYAVSTNGDSLDFNATSEYIALEMVCAYLVNTHTVLS